VHLQPSQDLTPLIPEPPWSPRLVIFDVFNTLVLPEWGHEGTFADGLRHLGMVATPQLLRRLQLRSEGVEHTAESRSRADYLAWTTRTVGRPVTTDTEPDVIPALEQLHQAPMRALPGVHDLLSSLRDRGLTIAVCSNWSWDLPDDLDACGLLPLIDVVVTSARAGYRKPHPAIYGRVLAEAGMVSADAIYVGDSLTADVDGPKAVGIPAVHLLRSDEPSPAPWQIGALAELWGFLTLGGGIIPLGR
jgi:putative hydrolase of the HAD superfamily